MNRTDSFTSAPKISATKPRSGGLDILNGFVATAIDVDHPIEETKDLGYGILTEDINKVTTPYKPRSSALNLTK